MIAIVYHLVYSWLIIILSWILGIGANAVLRTTKFYHRLTIFHFIKNESTNRLLGINVVKWMIQNTVFRHLNPKLRDAKALDRNELIRQMVYAEVSHLAGFIFVDVVVIVLAIGHRYQFALILFFMNVISNLYPALLQQINKSRVEKIIGRTAYPAALRNPDDSLRNE